MPFQRSAGGEPPNPSTLPKMGYHVWSIQKIEDGPVTDTGPTMRWYLTPLDVTKPDRPFLLDKKGLPYDVNILTSAKVGPKSRAGKLCEAVFGVPLDLVDIDQLDAALIGGEFGAVLTLNEKGWPQVGDPVETETKAFPPRE